MEIQIAEIKFLRSKAWKRITDKIKNEKVKMANSNNLWKDSYVLSILRDRMPQNSSESIGVTTEAEKATAKVIIKWIKWDVKQKGRDWNEV
jgi:hypothetical protein